MANHFIWGGGGSPLPCSLRRSSASPNSVILPHRSPDSGSFVTLLVANTIYFTTYIWSDVYALSLA